MIALFGEHLFDVVIHGSYVLGDFHPHKGDLDFILLFETDLSDAEISELFFLIGQYRDQPALLLHQLAGTAYPRNVLLDPSATFSGCYIGTGRAGWKRIQSFHNTFIELRVIAEKGRSLLDRSIQIYTPSEKEILREQQASLTNWRKSMAVGPIGMGLSSAIVHWSARTIYYRQTGRISSKTEACSRFADLFEDANGRRYPFPKTQPNARRHKPVAELLDFVSTLLDIADNDPLNNECET